MTSKIVPVIMAGGKGTRLWPLSRATAPKQFLQLLDSYSLFQKTLQRVADQDRFTSAVIVTNSEFRFIVAEQARALAVPLSSILLEPTARNTAPALAAAAFVVLRDYGDEAVMQVLASDHEINAGQTYFDCIEIAHETAKSGKLVTFGIRPTEPATGYGYIEIGEKLATGAHLVARFVEKPDSERAKKLIESDRYLWNSGMFMLPVRKFLDEILHHAPTIYEAAEEATRGALRDLDFHRLDEAAFSQAPDISVDFAVFEKTSHAAVVPSSFSWSDLGSWDAVWTIGNKDPAGNVVGPKTTIINTHNSLVLSQDIHLVVQGLNNMAVIASEDAVYVGPLEDSQNVGQIVKQLALSAETVGLTKDHPTSYRPWGSVASIAAGDRFKVKRLCVAAGRKISLHQHYHRAEHWIIARGTAEITIDGQAHTLHENESVYIPQGAVHRLKNPGKISLELIEVQTGSYLEDDDIIRFEDESGRF